MIRVGEADLRQGDGDAGVALVVFEVFVGEGVADDGVCGRAGREAVVLGEVAKAGAATPLAAAALSASMITAIKTSTWRKGLWIQKGGYEYNLVLILAAATLAEQGPGPISVDHLLGAEHPVSWNGIDDVEVGQPEAVELLGKMRNKMVKEA